MRPQYVLETGLADTSDQLRVRKPGAVDARSSSLLNSGTEKRPSDYCDQLMNEKGGVRNEDRKKAH